jgi:hypothetical protein
LHDGGGGLGEIGEARLRAGAGIGEVNEGKFDQPVGNDFGYAISRPEKEFDELVKQGVEDNRPR